jgi:hypothetical protein
VLVDEFAGAQLLIQLAHENQAADGADPQPLEIELQESIEQELKRLILFPTYSARTSGPSSAR